MTITRRLSFSLSSLFSLTHQVVWAIPTPKRDKDDNKEKKPKKNGPPVKVVAGETGKSANGKPVFTVGDDDKGTDKDKGKEKDHKSDSQRSSSPPSSDPNLGRPLPVIVQPPPGSDSVSDGDKQSAGPANALPSEPSPASAIVEPVTETLTTPKAFFSYEEGLVQDGSQIYEGVWVPSTRSGPAGEYGCVLWTQDGQEPTTFWRPQCPEPALTWWAWVIIVLGALLVVASCVKCSRGVAWFRARRGGVVGAVVGEKSGGGKVAPESGEREKR